MTKPSDILKLLIVAGLTLQLLGCFIAYQQYPRTEVGVGGPVETGNPDAVFVGVLVFGLGGVMSLIAVIGFGTKLGLAAHERQS